MIRQVLLCCTMFVVGSFASCGCATKAPPMSDLYEILQDFPKVNFCNRTFITNVWMDPGNVRKATVNGPIHKNEAACEIYCCFYQLINQEDWLDGVRNKYYHHKCNQTVTIEFSGKPDPTYNPLAKSTFDQPLKKMTVIVEQFKNNTQMFGVRCRSHWIEDKCGCLHVMIECPIKCESDAEKFCHKIIDYFNQKTANSEGCLHNSTTHCNIRGKTLEIEFIGNTKEGVNCTAPRYYQYEKLLPSLVAQKN